MSLDSLSVALIYLCLPWLLVEAASRVLRRLSSRKGSAVLSLPKKSSREARVSISRGPFWIKIETISLNELPGQLLRQINRIWQRGVRPNCSNGHGDWEGEVKYPLCQQARVSLELLYDAGTIFAGVALVGSIIFLIYGAFDLIG